jgi:hypothetical protein
MPEEFRISQQLVACSLIEEASNISHPEFK